MRCRSDSIFSKPCARLRPPRTIPVRLKIAIIGGGPAGLYCAYLLKRARPKASIHLVEQNPANATFGFGVVFSEHAPGFLAKDDPETHTCITTRMEAWNDLTVFNARRDPAVWQTRA